MYLSPTQGTRAPLKCKVLSRGRLSAVLEVTGSTIHPEMINAPKFTMGAETSMIGVFGVTGGS